MWYVQSKLISEGGIKRDGNSWEVYMGIRESKREMLHTLTSSSVNKIHSLHTLFPNLYLPTSRLTLFLKSLKLCPLVTPTSRAKNLPGSIQAVQIIENLVNFNKICPNKSCFKCNQTQKFSVCPSSCSPPIPSIFVASPLYLFQPINVLSQVRPPRLNAKVQMRSDHCLVQWQHHSSCLVFKPSLNHTKLPVWLHWLPCNTADQPSSHSAPSPPRSLSLS